MVHLGRGRAMEERAGVHLQYIHSPLQQPHADAGVFFHRSRNPLRPYSFPPSSLGLSLPPPPSFSLPAHRPTHLLPYPRSTMPWLLDPLSFLASNTRHHH